jgi:hypothetical protein
MKLGIVKGMKGGSVSVSVHTTEIVEAYRYHEGHVEVQVPIKPKALGGVISTHIVCFEEDIGHDDFFDCVCAYMDLPCSDAQLSYKWNFECCSDPAHQLLTAEDLAEAFQKATQMSSSK